jgi:hypothetical protein
MAARGVRKSGGKVKGSGTGRAVNYLRRSGMSKGILGGRRGWVAVFFVTWGYQKLKQLAQRDAEIVLSEELEPGQRIIIASGRPTIDN